MKAARTTALCCSCGEPRSVSTGYRGRPGDACGEARDLGASRCVVTLRCGHCRASTPHASLREDADRDWAEQLDHDLAKIGRGLAQQGLCPDRLALVRGRREWAVWLTDADDTQRALLARHRGALGLLQVDRDDYGVSVFLAPGLDAEGRLAALTLAHRAVAEPHIWPWEECRYYDSEPTDPAHTAWIAVLSRTGRPTLAAHGTDTP